jgi:PAS domain S-box-containing protein
VDIISVGLQAAFVAVFVVVLLRYLRDPRPVNRDLVIVAASVAGWFVLSMVASLVPNGPPIGQLTPVLILLLPVLTLRLVRHFAPVPRNLLLASAAWYVVALALTVGVGTRGNVAVTAVVVGYFVVFEAAAAVLLDRSARERIGYARTRLRLAAFGTLLFAAGIFVAGVSSAFTPVGEPANQTLTVATRLLALAAGLAYLVAFMPPQPLRRIQQRAVAFEIGQELILAPDGDPDAVWQALAQTASRVTAGSAAVVALGEPPAVRAIHGTPPAVYEPGAVVPMTDGVPETEGRSSFAVPIGIDEPIGWLIAFVPFESLFIEDDRILLGLLADQAARSAERQQALLERHALETELEDTSHELAESKALLEGEARFRVALEAHPGILLVVDPDGLIGYANEQALRTLGYDRNEIRTVPLRELLTTAPALGEATHGVMPAEARRQDGTVLPVDYAVSTFDSGGQQYSIAVLTDISDRLQTERLRDTFIGMLSHELRTPVTAIYGGSQVLLSRADKLDASVRQELIADVASESERLHRLIENLLVLARVERGQDLAGGEPVLLQRVLPMIVERERALWPGTSIEMVISPGLPTVRGHDGYVGQVIRNLLSNAAKYAGDGSSVQIRAESEENGVIVRILDDGAGIDATHAEHLFDLYYRAPGAADRAPGAGIGLFVCRHIVTALGGRIWARPRPDGGAEFGFELPIYEPDDEPLPVDAGGGKVAAIG